MRNTHRKIERHYITRIGWLRAAVLGANDGIISTASLISGVAASGAGKPAILLTGVAALVAGALSMAAGEYVSVSSQSDTENADLARERQELKDFPDAEHEELKQIYMARGLEDDLADKVATQLMATDALGAHARDELGLSEHTESKPVQAALASALTFASGALLPLIVVLIAAVLDRLGRHRGLRPVPGRIGCARGTGRRRSPDKGYCARHFLGCGGHGRHGRHRQAVPYGNLGY